MSRQFTAGSTTHITTTTTPVTGYPFTMSMWINQDSAATYGVASINNSLTSGNNQYVIGGNTAEARVRASSGFADSHGGSILTGGGWYHLLGVFTSSTDRLIYLDGVAGTTNTTDRTPTNIDNISLGRLGDSSPGNYFSGQGAEFALWDMALSSGNATSLAGGANPLAIEAGNLQVYATLEGDTFDDQLGNVTFSNTGTTDDADHPTIDAPPAVSGVPTLTLLGVG